MDIARAAKAARGGSIRACGTVVALAWLACATVWPTQAHAALIDLREFNRGGQHVFVSPDDGSISFDYRFLEGKSNGDKCVRFCSRQTT